jgi:hypothetical protein
VGIILSAVALAIFMAFQHQCQQERGSQRPPKQANIVTTVWIPGPEGGMMPYAGVEVLEHGTAFVKFRTENDQIIEQHGPYRIETSKGGY